MRELITIDFNEAQKTPYDCGRLGEHNAQPMSVTPPEELDGADYYRVVFDDGMNPVYSGQLTAAPFAFTLAQEITEKSPVKMWVEGYKSDASYIGKSRAATLVFGGPRASGEPSLQDTEPRGLLIELLAAKDAADEAAEYANDAGIEALSKASAANDARIAANGAASSSNAAASSANNAALSANAAAEIANDKAGLADEKAILADTAARNADQAVITLTGTVNSAVSQAQEDVAGALQTMAANLATFEDVTEAIGNTNGAAAAAEAATEDTIEAIAAAAAATEEAISAAGGVVTNGSVTPQKTSFLIISRNMFNPATVIIDKKIRYGTGEVVTDKNSLLVAGDYMPVLPNTQYVQKEGHEMAFYTAERAYISGLNYLNLNPRVVTTPENCYFVRTSAFKSNYETVFQFELGSTATAYQSYSYYKVPATAIADDYVTPVAELANTIADGAVSSISKTTLIVIGKNKFDKRDVTAGRYIKPNDGTVGLLTNYSASGYIPVIENTSYCDMLGYSKAFYNSAKVYISGVSSSVRVFTSPENAAYIRVGVMTENLEKYQLEIGTEPTAYEPYQHVLSEGYVPSIYSETIVMPSKLYGIVGKEINVYFDNVVFGKASKYDFNVTYTGSSSSVTHHNERVRIIPNQAGTFSLTIEIYKDGIYINMAVSSVIVKAGNVGNAVTKSLIVIGDSTTDTGEVITEINTLFGAGDVMDISLLGTRGTAPNLHEGRAGWKASHYTGSASYASLTNSFWDGSAFNFPWYMTQNSYASVDYVAIAIGINDTLKEVSDAENIVLNTTTIANIQAMVDSIKAFNGGSIIVGVCLVLPPASNQDAFGANYKAGLTQWRHKRNLDMLNKEIIKTFGGLESSGIYVVPINTNLDTVNNMLTTSYSVNSRNSTQIVRQSNALHPAVTGYNQIADVYYYWIKSFES